MLNRNYERPGYKKEAFNCLECTVFSKHDWFMTHVSESCGYFENTIGLKSGKFSELYSCRCQKCGHISFWYKGKLIWPLIFGIERPMEEMPEDIKELYNEAASIIELSPKGACALLRLALQKLCNKLADVSETTDLNDTIQILVDRGLPVKLQQAMDTVRIVGNDAVHPGEIVLDDNKELAYMMFGLMNLIVDKIIVEPMEIEELYNSLPEKKIEGIKNRNKKNKEQ